MSEPSKVLVLDPDPRAGRQVQLGFEREGIPAVIPQVPFDATKLELSPEHDPALILVGGVDGRGLDLVRRARKLLLETHADVPIVFAGRGVSRADALAAGADEIVLGPTYLRDLVTLTRLLRGVPLSQRDRLVGSLAETTGVYTLVRALSALGRSAVLTLIRGLRRGEIRFFNGEVTSAQVGLIHGQAALHQLLLWTDARFDYSHEDIVRRQQIPLAPEELFADAERFLESVRETSGSLSPSMVLEQDVQRVHNYGKQIPTEVHGVLRMFDGHRVLADVLEDSPYRLFETLRVAQKAMDAGLLRPVESAPRKAGWRTVLAIEEWLVGESRDEVVERTARLDSTPIPKSKKRKKRKSKPPSASRPDIDWGALVPRVIGAEVGPLSGVVPAQESAGEIDIASRAAPREKLEALMDTDKRQRIFPTDIGLEPSVVFSEADLAADEARVKQLADEAEAQRKADAEAAEAKRVAEENQRAEQAAADAKRAAEAAVAVKAEVARNAAAEEARAYAAQVKAAAEAKRAAEEAAAQAEADRIKAAADAVAKAEAEQMLRSTEAARGDRAAASMIAEPVPAPAPPVVVPPPATPVPAEDAPSDGVVQEITSADTEKHARLRARRPSTPEHDGPAIKEATGEIRERTPSQQAPVVDQPSILVSDSDSAVVDVPPSGPSVLAVEPQTALVGDLAALHGAVSAAAAAPPAATVDAKSPARERDVAEVRKDANELSEAEEAFFRRADHSQPHTASTPRVESFDDLDEGYEPPKFWDRVFGRKSSPLDKPKK